MALKGAAKRAIQTSVDNLTNFRIGNVSGNVVEFSTTALSIGKLDNSLAKQLLTALESYDVYVIYSYQTPIAWCVMDGKRELVIPDVKYSVTTTNHQNVVKTAIANESFYAETKW